MTLPVIEVEVPTDEYDHKAGGHVKEPATGKLLPSPALVHMFTPDTWEVSVSAEIAGEVEVGDVIAVPPVHGEPHPFEITGEPRTKDDQVVIPCKPAQSKRTFSVRQAEENARYAEMGRRTQRAENARLDRAMEETERGLEMLRETGFTQLADAVEGDVRLEIALREDLEAMEVADELEPAAT